jgi:hypothetical protein
MKFLNMSLTSFLFLVFLVLVAGTSLYERKWLDRLQQKYPEEYRRAGKPTWYLHGLGSGTFLYYVFSNKYKLRIHDAELVKFFYMSKILFAVAVVLLIFLAASISWDVENLGKV